MPKQLCHMVCPPHPPLHKAQPDIYTEEAKKEVIFQSDTQDSGGTSSGTGTHTCTAFQKSHTHFMLIAQIP